MTKEELGLLLYLETCLADYGGSVDARHMNGGDFTITDSWNAIGFIHFGRVYSKDVMSPRGSRRVTNWVEFSDDAWEAAHKERRARALRLADKRWWQKAQEE